MRSVVPPRIPDQALAIASIFETRGNSTMGRVARLGMAE
jgi:hypothetical protein